MKALVVLSVLVALIGCPGLVLYRIHGEEPIEDLGVITPKIGIRLEQGSTRSDFSHWEAEFLPLTPPTNLVRMTFTNAVITLTNLAALPSGRMMLGLASVYADGTQSAAKLYRFDIRRGPPPPPAATTFQFLGVPEETRPMRLVDHLSSYYPPQPPMPSLPTETPSTSPIPPAERWAPRANFPSALPGGTNRTYGQHLDAQADYYNKPGRRNER